MDVCYTEDVTDRVASCHRSTSLVRVVDKRESVRVDLGSTPAKTESWPDLSVKRPEFKLEIVRGDAVAE